MPEQPFSWGETLPLLPATRVALRELRPGDVPALFKIFSDPVVMRYWSTLPLADVAAAEKLFHEIRNHFEARTLFQWGIARRSDDAVIGTCTLYRIEPQHRRAEVGFALGASHWGAGLMTEALTEIIRFAFERLGLHRLEADVDPRNERSIRCLERQGFRREGYLRERYYVAGETQDTVLLGLLRRDWQGCQAQR